MSDAPRTDAYIEQFPGCLREPKLLDFCRRLEKQLAEARAEIERLKAKNAILDSGIADMTEEQAALCAEDQSITELVARKDAQIEQMREALRLADDLIDDYAMVVDHYDNVDEVRDMIKAVLEAAERASKT